MHMIQQIKLENLTSLRSLVEKYLKHIDESDFFEPPLDQQLKWYTSGISKHTLWIIGSYNQPNVAKGYLVHDINNHRTPIIFANGDFTVEKALFDDMFQKFSSTSPYLIFESGYPTPWISQELSDYAISLGFSEYPRQYMRLERLDELHQNTSESEFELVNCSESLLEAVSKMVFKCVKGTDDQVLFPYVYGTYESILNFHERILNGQYGNHKSSYSWVLMDGSNPIGSSFMMTDEDVTGYLMHLAIDPEYRRHGLGRFLLVHSIMNLFNIESNLTGIELAVTNRNPAMHLYESIGFKRVNDSSTYVWKKEH
jgi:GNAT superfamily N-acetyltransferase